ncbi:recombinase family protein [Halobacillus shinanisalinarum]|uniref:recombinase family protein n=1 Tax=Halobacillus shinanisalinarum TaxID=2932258 RepID=UPI0037BE45A5
MGQSKHLLDLIYDFQEKRISFVSINRNIDTITTAMENLVFAIFSGLDQFEVTLFQRNEIRVECSQSPRAKKWETKLKTGSANMVSATM